MLSNRLNNNNVFFSFLADNLCQRLYKPVSSTCQSETETNLLWFKNNAIKIENWITTWSKAQPEVNSSTRIGSLNIILMTLIALISYLLTH